MRVPRARSQGVQPTSWKAPGAFVAASDAELVLRAREGDRWAEEAIFRRHVDGVLGLATRILGRKDEADDVAQETFVAALAGLERLADPTHLEGWLRKIAIHRCRRRLRSRRFWSMLGMASDEAFAKLASSDASPEVVAELVAAERVLLREPTIKRMAWQLRRVEGHSLEEVATLVEVSLATAKRYVDAIDAALAAARKEAPHG